MFQEYHKLSLEVLLMERIALIRIIVFVLAWINQYLVSSGHHPIPFVDENSVANVITFVVSIYTLFTDNKVKKVDKQSDTI